MFNIRPSKNELAFGHKVAFLNSVFLFAGIVAFAMGFYRWQVSALMGAIDFGFSVCSFALVYYLNRHKEHVEGVGSIALILSYLLFTAIYLLAPYNATRITLFFLLSASAFFLKGLEQGFVWLFMILLTIVGGHFLPGLDTAYSHLDIVMASLYLLALYFIIRNYEIFKESINERDREQEVLRVSEERFRAMVESGYDIIVILSEAGVVRFASPSVESILGYAPEQMIGRHIHELVHADERQKTSDAMMHLLTHPNEKKPKECECLVKHQSGSYRNIELVCRNLIGNPVIAGIVLNGRDVTERKRAELELAGSRQELDAERLLFQAILDNSPLGVWMLGIDGKIKFINKTFCHAVGISEQQFLTANSYVELLPPANSANCVRSDHACYEQATPNLSLEWLPFVDGKEHLLEITKVKLRDHEGRILGLIGLAADITERKLAEDKLRLTAKVFENTLEGITITDDTGTIIDLNAAYSNISGYSREELIGQNPRVVKSGHQSYSFYEAMWQSILTTGHWKGEIWNRNKNGELHPEWLTISAITDEQGRATHYVGISSDITLLKQHEKQLEHIAHYDALTGIPNRTLLGERMKQDIAQTARDRNLMAICYLDLDGFKPINDTMGHGAGDRVLIEIAHRIQHTIRACDTVARLGGDEFVIMLMALDRADECTTTLNRLLAVISEPIVILDKSFTLSASIGVSIYPLNDEAPDTLLRQADQAMYMAKQSGKNRFHLYDSSLDKRSRDQQQFMKSIRHGLENGQFELYYQPKVDLRTRLLTGVEALIRWHHPELGLLSPDKFLPAIEKTALDIALGEWVIASALRQQDLWRATGLDTEVSINISAHHLESAQFVDRLRQQISLHPNLPMNRFQIEVLETTALEDVATVVHIIEQCKQIGVRYALDDFGTGYSSLSYLSSLPVDTLKIDQSFMHNMDMNQGDHAIILGIIALAKAFGLKTVAEGIESAEQFHALLEMGCETGQGYAIARPMPAAQLHEWARLNRGGQPLF